MNVPLVVGYHSYALSDVDVDCQFVIDVKRDFWRVCYIKNI